MTKDDAPLKLLIGDLRIGLFQEHGEAPHVMIAKEGWQLPRGGGPVLVNSISLEQSLKLARGLALGDHTARRALKREVEHSGQSRTGGKFGKLRRIWIIDLAEHGEMPDPFGAGVIKDCGGENLPEFGVHMLGGVDAKTIDFEISDPLFLDSEEAGDHARVRSHQIVKPGKVARQRVLAFEAAVAAVVVINRIVEPGRVLDSPLSLGDIRRVSIIRVSQVREVFRRLVPRIGAQKASVDRLAVG